MDGLQSDCSVFIRVEQPTLVSRYFEQITFVNAHNFNDQRVFSLLNGADLAKRQGLNETLDPLRKRNSINVEGYCPNWKGYGDDPNGNCKRKKTGPPYSAGSCGIHLVQYRATKGIAPISPDWGFNITLKDSNVRVIGGIDVDILGGTTFDLSNPIKLAYGGWSALTKAPACSVGGYDNNYRQMDCGFPCA